MEKSDILILGIGNYLMGDEGVGVHAIHYLEKQEFPSEVTLMDGGTGGFHLLSHMESFKKVILIDASLDEHPEGSVRVLSPKFPKDFPQSLSAHEIGLRDLIESLYLIDKLPEIKLIAVSVKKLDGIGLELSPAVKPSLEEISSLVHSLLKEWQAAFVED